MGGFVDCQVVELRAVSLVKEQDATGQLLNDQIPRIDRACARHEMGQDRVRDKDIAISVNGKLLQNRIIRRGDGIELLRFVPLERHGRTSAQLVVGIVVLIQETTPKNVFFLGQAGRGRQVLGKFGQINFFHLVPVRLNSHRGLSINAGTVVLVVVSTTSIVLSTASRTLGALHLVGRRLLLLPTSVDLSQTLRVLAAPCCWRDKPPRVVR
mmetsp:Transcript_12430/g.21062  ORF Transcript_12430/g.21062 Transcript_12430/m.21062 type:complete len:211 (-) Transcript_12430:230-862(-)